MNDPAKAAAEEIAVNYEIHKNRCHSNERYPSPPCDCSAIQEITVIISKHFAAAPAESYAYAKECLGCIASRAGVGRCIVHELKLPPQPSPSLADAIAKVRELRDGATEMVEASKNAYNYRRLERDARLAALNEAVTALESLTPTNVVLATAERIVNQACEHDTNDARFTLARELIEAVDLQRLTDIGHCCDKTITDVVIPALRAKCEELGVEVEGGEG